MAEAKRRDDPARVAGRKPRARKDTKRWCKGVVGREHRPAVRLDSHFSVLGCGIRLGRYWFCSEQEYCTACDKVLRRSLGQECTYLPKG